MEYSQILTKETHLPKYRQIAKTLRERILNGELAEGTKLPTEPELAEELGVNHLTLRKGLAILASQNLISQTQGKGTFVSFRQRVHRRIGIISYSEMYQDAYFMRLLLMLSKVVSSREDCELVLLSVENIDKLNTNQLLNMLNHSKCDGIFIIAADLRLTRMLNEPEFDHINMVFCNTGTGRAGEFKRHFVESANTVTRGLEYLYGLGHRRIGYLTIDSGLYGFARERNEEFYRTMEKLNLPADLVQVSKRKRFNIHSDEWYDDCRTAMSEMCRMRPDERPTAVIGANMSCILGAWQGVMDACMKVPDDISLLGVDADISSNPHLSALAQPLEQITEEALNLLFSMDIPGKHLKKNLLEYDAVIIERGSCRSV